MEVSKKLNIKKLLFSLISLIISILIIIGLIIILIYNNNLRAVSNSNVSKQIEIVKGNSSREIASKLKKYNLIRDEKSFIIYLKINKINELKYGIYLFSENMDVKEIVEKLQNGSTYNPDEVTLTIQEGLNMREIARIISSKTSNSYDDVINKSNDIEYIKKLIDKYWFITNDVLNDGLYYKLEGYLFPDTYSLINKDVDVEYIFDKMIGEMAKKLEEYKNYDYNTLSIHQRLTLASMIEEESSVSADRTKMASVFLNRMKKGMNLGSDVTARYASKLDDKRAMYNNEIYYKSPYNTRLNDGSMNGKLPIGPISTISKSSIDASFNPSNDNYLYFIANIKTLETFYYENYNDFLAKKNELANVNQGY